MKFQLEIVVVILLWCERSFGQTCYCALEDSTKYPETFKWNCMDKSIIAVPKQCWQQQSANVSEVNLMQNLITTISIGDFDALTDLQDIYLDNNKISSIESSALAPLQDLRYLSLNSNPNLTLPNDVFVNNVNLEELYVLSSHIGSFPNLTSLINLKSLDARSCNLGPLNRPTFGKLVQTEFVLNLYANNFTDIAADILLPIPSEAKMTFDSTVIIWAKDIFQEYDVIDKNWDINLDLEVSLKVCDYDGNPQNPEMC